VIGEPDETFPPDELPALEPPEPGESPEGTPAPWTGDEAPLPAPGALVDPDPAEGWPWEPEPAARADECPGRERAATPDSTIPPAMPPTTIHLVADDTRSRPLSRNTR